MSQDELSQYLKKAKFLRFSVIATFLALVPTFYVALASGSVTLYADALRSTAEFSAILFSWLVFRKIRSSDSNKYSYGFGKLEQFASLVVGITMLITFAIALFASIYRFINPAPIVNATSGIIVTILSVLGNLAVWMKNLNLYTSSPSALILSQARLFRAKTFISLAVLIALLLGSYSTNDTIKLYADPLGSLAIAVFMFYSAINVLSSSISDLLDKSIGDAMQISILRALVENESEYSGYLGMRTRLSGGHAYVDIFLQYDPSKTIREVKESMHRIKLHIQKAVPNSDISIIIS